VQQSPSRNDLLRQLRDEKHFATGELLSHLSRLVPRFVGKQVRHKVVDVPTERTVRYYRRESLIDGPSRSGRRGKYAYRHVLQILVIKLLQSENFTLRKISEVTGRENGELEAILLGDRSRRVFVPDYRSAPFSGLSSIREEQSIEPSSFAGASLWRKFRVVPGIELHIEDGFRLSESVRFVLERMSGILAAASWDETHSFGREPTAVSTVASGNPAGYPAPSAVSRSTALVALLTEGGLVPKGNPDKLESAKAGRFLRYSISGMDQLMSGQFESVDRGWDNAYVNGDPNRLLPVDAMVELEKKGVISRTFDYFYTTTGVATPLDDSRKLGESIASELKSQGISAVILTCT
jgi:DNA-binding transcriptional MerR regulator